MVRMAWSLGTILLVTVVSLTVLAAPQEAVPATDKIDVNTADEALLQEVPGIGPAMARRIVEWRAEHGPFERLDDLLDIRGIGLKTLEKFRPYLEVRDEADGEEG